MKLSTPLLIGIVSVIILGGGIFFISSNPDFGSGKKSQVSPNEGIGQYFESQGQEHIAPGATHNQYNSNPPSSGPHWAEPAINGAHEEPVVDEQAIHNLEHGYVWIAYKPDLPSDMIEKLKSIVNEDNWKVVSSPRSENDSPIALVAWTRVLKLETYDEDQIKEFIKTYRDRGPEATPN